MLHLHTNRVLSKVKDHLKDGYAYHIYPDGSMTTVRPDEHVYHTCINREHPLLDFGCTCPAGKKDVLCYHRRLLHLVRCCDRCDGYQYQEVSAEDPKVAYYHCHKCGKVDGYQQVQKERAHWYSFNKEQAA